MILAAALFAATPAMAQPPAPTGLTASAVGDTEATLSWTEPKDNSCTIVDYFLRVYGPSGTQAQASYIEETSYTVVGLAAGTSYSARVWSYGECDDYSAPSDTASFTTNAANNSSDPEPASDARKLVPKRPTNITAATSSGTTTISWTAPANPGNAHCAVLDYSVEVTNLSDNSSAALEDYITDTDTTLTGLVSGTEYEIEVWAYSGDCDEWSYPGVGTPTPS